MEERGKDEILKCAQEAGIFTEPNYKDLPKSAKNTNPRGQVETSSVIPANERQCCVVLQLQGSTDFLGRAGKWSKRRLITSKDLDALLPVVWLLHADLWA